MAETESPKRDPISPEREQQSQLTDEEDIGKDCNSDKEIDEEDKTKTSALEEVNGADISPSRTTIQSDEEDRLSETKPQDSDNEQNQIELGKGSPKPKKENEIGVNDLLDEASSVIRELDEHELDYDEEVPEEPLGPLQEDEADKFGDEDEKEKVEDSSTDEKKSNERKEDKDGAEPSKEKKKADDDGEIDEGEIDDDDLEEGEVKDPTDRKTRPRLTCRFFMKGNCTWGMSCRFIHPGMNDKGNYSLISKPDPFSPNGTPPVVPHAQMPANPWGTPAVEELLPPPLPDPPAESAWERGLRHAKEVLKKATIRKEQEPDFEEKRFTVTIGEDDREFDKENEFFSRDWNYRITRDVRETGEVEYRETINQAADPYADPYYDMEMERFWRGGQYENFRVQYTEAEPYRYRERERERDRDRDRQRDRDRERDRERERRQRERERERERERDKERQKRKEEYERDRSKRDDKERTKDKEKDKEKTKTKSPLLPSRPNDAPKKEPSTTAAAAAATPASNPATAVLSPATTTPAASGGNSIKRADEWKDPWRRSKSPKKKLGISGSPSRGRRRRRTSGSSASASNSSGSSSRSSSYSGSGSSRSRSSSYSSYSSRSSRHSSFSGSRSRSGSFSSSPSPSPSPSPTKAPNKTKGEAVPVAAKGEKQTVKKPAPPPITTAAVKPPKVGPEPPKPAENRVARQKETKRKAPTRRRTISGSISGSVSSYSGSSSRSRSGSRSVSRSSRSTSASVSPSPSLSRKSRKSSVSSSSSSVRSADSEDMYADLASPISSASSRSPTPAQAKKEKVEKTKKEERVKEEKRVRDTPTQPPKTNTSKVPKPVTSSKAAQQPVVPPPAPSGFSAHKDIKLTLLNKGTDKGSRKRYEPSDKDKQGSPPAKKANLTPDRVVRDRKQTGKLPSPKLERQRVQYPKPAPNQPDRKRPLSPPLKSSSKVTSIPGKTEPAPASTGAKSGKASTLSRREELLKQLKAVEDAIARKRAKIPGKV